MQYFYRNFIIVPWIVLCFEHLSNERPF